MLPTRMTFLAGLCVGGGWVEAFVCLFLAHLSSAQDELF